MAIFQYVPSYGRHKNIMTRRKLCMEPVEVTERREIRGVMMGEVRTIYSGQYGGTVPVADLVKLPNSGIPTAEHYREINRRLDNFLYLQNKRQIAPPENAKQNAIKLAESKAKRQLINDAIQLVKQENTAGNTPEKQAENEAAAIAAMKDMGPTERLGKRQTRNKHRKIQPIAEDTALETIVSRFKIIEVSDDMREHIRDIRIGKNRREDERQERENKAQQNEPLLVGGIGESNAKQSQQKYQPVDFNSYGGK